VTADEGAYQRVRWTANLHPAPPSAEALLPYLDDAGATTASTAHFARYSFNPDELSAEFAAQRAAGLAAEVRAARRRSRHDPQSVRSIRSAPASRSANVLQARPPRLFNRGHAMALCSAIKRLGREGTARPPSRARASMLVPVHNPEARSRPSRAIGAGPAFLQVLLFAMGDMLLGRRRTGAVYVAAKSTGSPSASNAGSHLPATRRWRRAGSAHRVED